MNTLTFPRSWKPLLLQSVTHFKSNLLENRARSMKYVSLLLPRRHKYRQHLSITECSKDHGRSPIFILQIGSFAESIYISYNCFKACKTFGSMAQSYLFQWNRWQWTSWCLNFCSFLLRGQMSASWWSHLSPPSIRVNCHFHSLFSICFYFSLKTF